MVTEEIKDRRQSPLDRELAEKEIDDDDDLANHPVHRPFRRRRGYYAHGRYGGPGLGGVFGLVLVVLVVLWLVGALARPWGRLACEKMRPATARLGPRTSGGGKRAGKGANAPSLLNLEMRNRASMSDKVSSIDRVWSLIGDIPIAMVVTQEGQGENMRSRPMAARPAKDEGAIYFLTDAGTPKTREIRGNQSVCLALSDNKGQRYLSISGHAAMIDDRDRIKELWSVYDKAFWSDKNDPRIRVLRVTPESAESGRATECSSPRSNWSPPSLQASG